MDKYATSELARILLEKTDRSLGLLLFQITEIDSWCEEGKVNQSAELFENTPAKFSDKSGIDMSA